MRRFAESCSRHAPGDSPGAKWLIDMLLIRTCHPGMGNTLATMLTMTTYGTWLRGDKRGWVDDGKILPADPEREVADRVRMKHPVYVFPQDRLLEVGAFIGESLTSRLDIAIHALHVGTWHVHVVIGPTQQNIADIAKCAKDAVRYGLRPGRPIWTDGYDKRFCFDEHAVISRIRYVERHNEAAGLPPRPWPFIVIHPLMRPTATQIATTVDIHPIKTTITPPHNPI